MAGRQFVVYVCLAAFYSISGTSSQTTIQHCKYTSIHVVNEDGRQQIITIKDPDSDVSCGCQPPQQGTLESQCQTAAESNSQHSKNKRSLPETSSDQEPLRRLFQATGPDGLPYPANRIPVPPFQHGTPHWDMAPVVAVNVGDVMTRLCDVKTEDTRDICKVFKDIPTNSLPEDPYTKEKIEQCASYIVENGLLQVSSGDSLVDSKLAYGHVLIGAGLLDDAIEYFTSLIKEYPNLAPTYHGRGLAFSKKGLVLKLGERALVDYVKAAELEPGNPEYHQRMAEIYLPLGKYPETVESISRAVELSEKPDSRILFLKATLELAAENYKQAETDYRKSLDLESQPNNVQTFFNLAVTLYYRGMLRNSIEMYKELINVAPNNVEAHCGLAQAYSQLGEFSKAKSTFNKTLSLNSQHQLTLQLKGTFHYRNGDIQNALESFQKCLQVDPSNHICLYMEGLCLTTLGRFYSGIKGFTKIQVTTSPAVRMSQSFIKSNYIREYGRFLHHNLDENFLGLDYDHSFSSEFKNKWLKAESFVFRNPYTEQPGLSPSISDINESDFREWPMEIRELVCFSQTIGSSMQAKTDGILDNKRLHTAVGMASIHIAQAMKAVWQEVGTSKSERTMTWRKMFDIAVRYIRLADLEEPMFWLDEMDKEYMDVGYTHDVYIIKGHTINLRVMQYYDLVFKLIRTMIAVHCGEGEMYPMEVRDVLFPVETHEELIDALKNDIFRNQGFVMSTQMSSMKNPSGPKYEGAMLSMASDRTGKMILSVNLPYNREKAEAVYQEMDYIFFELYNEMKKLGGKSSEDPDHIINLILSLIYYFLNMSPITHGSSAVAWSVALGLIMSVGRDVTGRLSPGKLLELEAALSSSPESFAQSTKSWMKIKRMKDNPVSRLQLMSAALPTLRDIMEGLSQTNVDCWEVYALSKNIIL